MKIYEMITLTAAPTVMKDLRNALAASVKDCPGELVAAWATEVGQLNDVLILRRYDESAPTPTQLAPGVASWLDAALPFAQDLQIEHCRMFPGLEDPQPGTVGPLHELRSYVYRPGMMKDLVEQWSAPLMRRRQVTPNPMALISLDGRALRFRHLWVYQSFEDRVRIRAEAVAGGDWPPPGGKARWLSQENAILLPLPFSPLK